MLKSPAGCSVLLGAMSLDDEILHISKKAVNKIMHGSKVSAAHTSRKQTKSSNFQGIRGRIFSLVKEFSGENWADFQRLTGIPMTSLQRVKEGKTLLSAENILKVCSATKKSADWLLTGQEPDYREPRIIYFEADDPEIRSEFEQHEDRDNFVPVRILEDAVAMGPGQIVRDGTTKGFAMIYAPALPKAARAQKRSDEKIVCLLAQGDSMEPTIQDGALVAIDLRVNKPDQVENRKIYSVWLPEGGITLKRVVKSDGNLILIADNPDAEGFPLVLVGEDADRAIRGKMIWWWSRQE